MSSRPTSMNKIMRSSTNSKECDLFEWWHFFQPNDTGVSLLPKRCMFIKFRIFLMDIRYIFVEIYIRVFFILFNLRKDYRDSRIWGVCSDNTFWTEIRWVTYGYKNECTFQILRLFVEPRSLNNIFFLGLTSHVFVNKTAKTEFFRM